MKRHALFVISLVSLFIFDPLCSTFADSNQKVISEKDAEYILKGMDVSSGKFKPDTPQSETQQILSNSMKDFNQLNKDTNNKLTNIGPYEFSSFIELRDKANVSQLKSHLKEYWNVKIAYYDKMDYLQKKYKKELNYGSEQEERLAGTAAQLIEKLEGKFVADLNEFYDFILMHHEKMNFTEDQIYLEDQNLVKTT